MGVRPLRPLVLGLGRQASKRSCQDRIGGGFPHAGPIIRAIREFFSAPLVESRYLGGDAINSHPVRIERASAPQSTRASRDVPR